MQDLVQRHKQQETGQHQGTQKIKRGGEKVLWPTGQSWARGKICVTAHLHLPSEWCGWCDELGRWWSRWGWNEHRLGNGKLQGKDRKRCQKETAGAL